MQPVNNPELRLAFDFVQYTNRNIFLTGKAGTGKTTFLHNLKKICPKRMIVVAPTGVAAINAGGVTIHSFFQLPFHPHVPVQYVNAGPAGPPSPLEAPSFRLSREKVNIIKGLDLLVIDEISMVRADLLDAIDLMLRRFKNRSQPFGGVQLLMIGDIQQLAPVVKDEDREILHKYYDTEYFFGSLALRNTDYVTIELKHIYRQQDLNFIGLLNKIRENQLDPDAQEMLNSRYNPHVDAFTEGGYITLTTHNSQAQAINESKLNKIASKARTFEATIKDDFPEYAYPTPYELTLKTGAQVMFVKNDISRDKLFFNGKIGRIEEFDKDQIIVKCPDDDAPIRVERAEWFNMKYSLNEETKEIEETIIGTFIQFPLKLAWAITIHKSQGLTFDKAIIDAQSAFAHGQVYVALSRCRTLEGLVLSTRIGKRGIICDPTVSGFIRQTEKMQPDEKLLTKSKLAYQQMLLTDLFDFNALLRSLYYSLKVVKDNHDGLLGTPQEKIETVIHNTKNELIRVAEKFEPQINHLILNNPDAESNEPLQERIGKACEYFAGKLSVTVREILAGIVIETDNKAVRKAVSDALDKSLQESKVKQVCLEKMRTGFRIHDYLEVKARAILDIPAAKPKPVKTIEDASGMSAHPVLYNRIRKWRDRKAMESDVPHYMVLPLKTMATLSGFLPQTPEALKMVKGMGKLKSGKFGDELLALIREYCEEQNIKSPEIPVMATKVPVKTKEDTRRISLQMYQEGKTTLQIAGERNLSVTTIEGHLAHFIGSGELPVTDFVSPDMTELIAGHFEDTEYHLGPVKSALGDQVSWSDIRYVAKHLEFLRKKEKTI